MSMTPRLPAAAVVTPARIFLRQHEDKGVGHFLGVARVFGSELEILGAGGDLEKERLAAELEVAEIVLSRSGEPVEASDLDPLEVGTKRDTGPYIGDEGPQR